MPIAIKAVPYGSPEFEALLALRQRILRDPLGRAFTAEERARDKLAMHLGAFDGETAVGTLMVMPPEKGVARLRQMAVAEDRQGQDIGSRLMRHAEQLLHEQGVGLIFFHARAGAIGFYARHGFEVRGEPFVESTLPHVRMEKRLPAT